MAVTFDYWVNSQAQVNQYVVNGQNVTEYPFQVDDPHTVVGVGYIDPSAIPGSGDELFIAQDGWSTTVQYVAVPLIWAPGPNQGDPLGNTVWTQSDMDHG